jgi:alkylation response protein AidB-like acyl-CoA dehydrogenase
MAHLDQSLQGIVREADRVRGSVLSGAGVGAAELIRAAFEYAGHERPDAKGANALGDAQHLAEALSAVAASAKSLRAAVRQAAVAVHERDAKVAAESAAASRLRV